MTFSEKLDLYLKNIWYYLGDEEIKFQSTTPVLISIGILTITAKIKDAGTHEHFLEKKKSCVAAASQFVTDPY